ncbi:D-serine ammonia-lyase [Desulfobacterales bacterium HSG2]|nr:D-serine ammonia-lyase [Desulfobacterales bacterium HSG2]
MKETIIANKTISEWKAEHPLINEIMSLKEVFWCNPQYDGFESAKKKISLSERDVTDAEERLNRFAPFIAKIFPETYRTKGIIESPIIRIPNTQKRIEQLHSQKIGGTLLLKCDSHLPISGSIKARGGICEVLKHAEDMAVKNNMLTYNDDYSVFDSEKFRAFFSQYSVAVGSTGNLGLSIGIMGTQIGFKVFVHMSADAKKWKKDLLRSKGVKVIEYESDYSKAVEEGRKQAQADPNMYFIDDENSTDLFLGYAVAANRLKKQLEESEVIVDEDHPLFAYLPCGVGGAAGGITFGLKSIYKDHVHCFFAEPTHSPCMLLGLMTRQHDRVSVQDFGIDNITEADGLAVGRPSGLVGKSLEKMISGVYTVEDDDLHILLSLLADSENIYAEPSAMAGMPGPVRLFTSSDGQKYLTDNRLISRDMKNATHIVWATGGSMVPPTVMNEYYKKGLKLLNP